MAIDPLETSRPLPGTECYTPQAIAFHWTMFVLVVIVGVLGLLHDDWPKETQGFWINLHVMFGLLLWVVAIEVLIFLASTLASMASNFFSLELGQKMTWSLAEDLFRHMQRLSLLFHTRRAVGDLIERVTTDCYSIDTLVTGAALPVVQASLTLVLMFVIMGSLEWRLTLFAIAG